MTITSFVLNEIRKINRNKSLALTIELSEFSLSADWLKKTVSVYFEFGVKVWDYVP